MIIKLIPQYRSDALMVVRSGDLLTVNGEAYDFGPLPNGATLPAEAINSPFIVGDVDRDSSGVLHLALLLPIQRAVFHDVLPDIVDPQDGPIELPVITEVA